MTPELSIVITACNDATELVATINSIRATAGDAPEILVVDDGSANAVTFIMQPEWLRGAKVITNAFRCGVGPSRHIGVQHATGKWVLIMDSHMRLPLHWYEKTMCRIQGKDKTLYSCSMLGLDKDHLDLDNPKQVYHGATLNLCGKDPNDPKATKLQVLEAVWNKPPAPEDDAEILLPMGASYLCRRNWFLELDPLRFLRGWGSDEVMLGLKAWLSGGEVRLLKSVRIGHIYTHQKDKKFRVPLGLPTYNKLFSIHTLLPRDLARDLEGKLKENTDASDWTEAYRLMRDNWGLFESERLRNQRMFTVDFMDLLKRFSLP